MLLLIPSMQIYLSDGNITSKDCDCPRGAYKCSHAAAIVIHAIHNLSRTDMEFSWKRQKLTDVVKSASELYPPSREYNPLKRTVTAEDRSWLYGELRQYGKFTGMAWILSPEPDMDVHLPIQSVEELILSPEFLQQRLKTNYLLEKLKISQDQKLAVSAVTKGQRESAAWHVLRKGRLTASNFGYILKAKRVTPSLIKRLLGEYNLSGVQAINWGISNEQEAIKEFIAATKHKVEETGLWLDPCGFLGASPDGLVGSDAVLEAKCPFTFRNSTIEEAIKSNEFFLTKSEDGSFDLKRDHVYWHQVQGQMHLTNRNICYFVVWTTKETVVIKVIKDLQWGSNLELLKQFYKSNILPKLVEGGM